MNANFGMNLIRLRTLKSLQINDIALLLGIDEESWRSFEFSLTSPTLEQVDKIAKFFSIVPSDLFMPYVASSNFNGVATAVNFLPNNTLPCAIHAKKYAITKGLAISSLVVSSIILIILFLLAVTPYSQRLNYSNNPSGSSSYYYSSQMILVTPFILLQIWLVVALIISLAMKKQSTSYNNWIKISTVVSFSCAIACLYPAFIIMIIFSFAYSLEAFPIIFIMYLYIAQMILNIIIFAKRKVKCI